MRAVLLAALAAALAQAAAPAAPPKPAAAPPVPAAEMRPVDPDNLLVVDTDKGRVLAEIYPAFAPASVAQFKTLARRHFYDGQTFFRVIEGFMDQTGDPTNTGKGGSDLPNLKAEFTFRRGADTPFVSVAQPTGSDVGFVGAMPTYSQAEGLMAMTADGKVSAWGAFCSGVLGMARADEPDSANSQFFFMRGAYPALEKRYATFGRVLVGQAAIDAIKPGEPVPAPQDRMLRVRLASDLPPAERPRVLRQDPAGPAFAAQVAAVRKEKGADFSVCDVTPAAVEAKP